MTVPDYPDRSAMEVVRSGEDNGLPVWHTLLHVCPLPCQFDSCLDSFRTGIHGQNHVIPEHLGDELSELSEYAVVKCPGGERESLRLGNKGVHDLGVAMTLREDVE